MIDMQSHRVYNIYRVVKEMVIKTNTSLWPLVINKNIMKRVVKVKSQFYGKVYNATYYVEPMVGYNPYEIETRVEYPEEYIKAKYDYIKDYLIEEKVINDIHLVDDRVFVDNVFSLVERKEVSNGVVKYFTNQTVDVLQPTQSEYKKVKQQVIDEAQSFNTTKDNLISFNEELIKRKGLSFDERQRGY
jgi:hypothetical protein